MLKDDGYDVKKSTMHDRAAKGTLNYYQTSKSKFYKYEDVLREFGFYTQPTPPKENVIYDDEDMAELGRLLNETPLSPTQRIDITKNFWAAKQNWIKYKKEIGDVIPMSEAMSVIEVGVTNFKTKMYSIPQKIKSLYPYIKTDAINTLHLQIDEAFAEFHRGE
jgi:hypothetical protein